MGYVIQWAPALAGIIVAVTLVVALFQLVAIRKLLQRLLEQRQMPATQSRADVASERALWTGEAPAQAVPDRRLEIVSPPPPPAPVQQSRFAEAREQVMPAIVSPPPPPAPVEPMRFEEVPYEPPLPEGIEEEAAPVKVFAEQARPAESPATADPEPPVLAAPRSSRLPVIIGIVVLVSAIAFLAFLVIYTK